MSPIRASELRYRRLFEAAQHGILILDAESGAITDVNPFLIKMLGYSYEEFVKKKLWEVGPFKDIKASQEAFEALQREEYIRYDDLPLKTKDGRVVQVEFVSNVYLVDDEKVIQCNIRDITDRKIAQAALLKSEALLREQSVRDHLTGLFNRRYTEETLEREIHRALRKKSTIGLIMLDVDEFKSINDNYGHAAGDATLQSLSGFLTDHVRGEDIAARYGGDEFIVILPEASRPVTRERAELLCTKASQLQVQFENRILEMFSISVGVAVFPKNGSTRTDIMKAVDDALYQAKRAGRGRVMVAK